MRAHLRDTPSRPLLFSCQCASFTKAVSLLSAPNQRNPTQVGGIGLMTSVHVCLSVAPAVNSHRKLPNRLFLILAWVWLHLQFEGCSLEIGVYMGWNVKRDVTVVSLWSEARFHVDGEDQQVKWPSVFYTFPPSFSCSQSQLQCFALSHTFPLLSISFVLSPTLSVSHPVPPAQRGCGGWTCVFLIGLSDNTGCFLCTVALRGG